MGYMTVVSILNDAWENIKRHPDEFIENIEKGMFDTKRCRSVEWYSVGSYVNPMEVSKSFHADNDQVFYVGKNTMTNLTDWNSKSKNEIEFQLKRMKQAKSAINLLEKELKERLKKLDKYEKGQILICTTNYSKGFNGKVKRLFSEGNEYQIMALDKEKSLATLKTDYESEYLMFNILDLNKYFKLKENE